MSPTAFYGSLLAGGMIAVVAALLGWQWAERRHRSVDHSEQDRAHFTRQDVRRWVVAGVLTLLAFGVYLGSGMPYRRDGRPNLAFLEIWTLIFVLLLVLVGLALLDWVATRNYANRHRTQMVREGISILRDELRTRVEQSSRRESRGSTNGSPHE